MSILFVVHCFASITLLLVIMLLVFTNSTDDRLISAEVLCTSVKIT